MYNPNGPILASITCMPFISLPGNISIGQTSHSACEAELFCLYLTSLFPEWGHGVLSPVSRTTLSEPRSEIRSDTLPITSMSGILTIKPVCFLKIILVWKHLCPVVMI